MDEPDVRHLAQDAAVCNALSSANRIQAFVLLLAGEAPKQIADEVGISRSGLQPYFADFKDVGLITVEGKQYHVTEKGRRVAGILEELDALHEPATLGARAFRVLQDFFDEAAQPLDAVVDPEALDQLFAGEAFGRRLSFAYGDAEITIQDDGLLQVEMSEGVYEADLHADAPELQPTDL